MMARRFRVGVAVLGLGLGVAHAEPPAFVLPPETARLKAGPGSEMASGLCVLCHSADYISTQPRLSKTGWTAIVNKMREKYGAPLPAESVAAVADYLTRSYGDPTK